MADKEPKPVLAAPDVPLPLPVLVTAEQPPIPMMQIAPDGVTPVPIAGMSNAENTPPGSDTPVGQAATGTQVAAQASTGTPAQVTTTTTTTAPVPATVTKGEGTTLTPTTTEADDKVTEGQRRTSLLWESTQAAISIAITLAVIYCAVAQINSETITNAFFFIVATYFTRTNHTKIGGIGPKPYEGR